MSARNWRLLSRTPRGFEYGAVTPEGSEDWAVRVTFRIGRSSSGEALYAWVELRLVSPGRRWQSDPPFLYGQYNLMGARTISSLEKSIESSLSSPTVAKVLARIIGDIVYDCVQRFWEGPEPVELDDVDLDSEPRWLLRPWLERSTHTRFIAAGGVGKSWFALALGAVVATGNNEILHCARPQIVGPVAYLDWEADAATHAERLKALAAGAGVGPIRGIQYFQMREKLTRQASAMATAFERSGVVLAIIDSNMLARGPAGERGGMEDTTVAMFEAMRELAVPCLIIDHKSAEFARKGKKGGYGSIVNTNSARVEWDIYSVAEAPSGYRWKAANTKANNVRKQPDECYEAVIKTTHGDRIESIVFTPLSSMNEGTVLDYGDTTLPERMALVLREKGALTNSTLAAHLDITPEHCRVVRSRLGDRLRSVPGTNPPRYELADGPADQGELPGNII